MFISDNTLSKKNIKNNSYSLYFTKKYTRKDSVYTDVYIHFGVICLKFSALFLIDNVIIQGRIYPMRNAIYNDKLNQIKLESNKNLRIAHEEIYNYIKKMQKNNILTTYYYNNI